MWRNVKTEFDMVDFHLEILFKAIFHWSWTRDKTWLGSSDKTLKNINIVTEPLHNYINIFCTVQSHTNISEISGCKWVLTSALLSFFSLEEQGVTQSSGYLMVRTAAEHAGTLTTTEWWRAGKVKKQPILCSDEDLLWRKRGHSGCRSTTGMMLKWRCSTLDDTGVALRPCMRFCQNSWWCNLPSTASWNLQSPFSADSVAVRRSIFGLHFQTLCSKFPQYMYHYCICFHCLLVFVRWWQPL